MRHRVSVQLTDRTQERRASCPIICVSNEASRGEHARNHLPAQMQEMYAVFNTWKEKFQENIVDMGGKLGGGKSSPRKVQQTGPFVEAKEVVGGFMIVSAESLEEATEVARECPGVVMPGSSVEVREIHTP